MFFIRNSQIGHGGQHLWCCNHSHHLGRRFRRRPGGCDVGLHEAADRAAVCDWQAEEILASRLRAALQQLRAIHSLISHLSASRVAKFLRNFFDALKKGAYVFNIPKIHSLQYCCLRLHLLFLDQFLRTVKRSVRSRWFLLPSLFLQRFTSSTQMKVGKPTK